MSNFFSSLNNNNSNSPASGATSTQAGGSSLFSGGSFNQQPQQQNNTGSNLFGSLGVTSQAQQNPASTGIGIFGSLGATSQPQAGGSSLFSGGSFNQQPQQSQQQTGTGPGLFGTLGATSQPAGGGFGATSQSQQNGRELFGASTNNINQVSSNTGGLGGLGSQPQQQGLSGGLGNSQQQQPLSDQSQNGQSRAYFDSILEKGRKRAHDDNSLGLQLGLGDLRRQMKRFGSGAQEGSSDVVAAHYLLAASGVDPGAAIKDLNSFNPQASRFDQTHQEMVDTDVETYLSNLQTQTTLSMISDGFARSVRDFDNFLEDHVSMEWDAQRKRIYQHFGIKPKEGPVNGARSKFASTLESHGTFGRSRRTKGASLAGSRTSGVPGGGVLGRSNLQKSVIGSIGPIGSPNQTLFADVEKNIEENGGAIAGPSDAFQREKQNRFIEKVQSLNLARLGKQKYPILHEFKSVVRQGGEQHATDVISAYEALAEIVQESAELESLADRNSVKERQFADAYLDDAPNSAKSRQISKRILERSARYLEKAFYKEVETLVAKNPQEAKLGGIPNVISHLKAYIRLRISRKDLAPDNTDLQMLGEDYVWALVYYLLRSGYVQEAVDYVTENSVAFRAIDRNFSAYIHDYNDRGDRRLRRELQERISSEYNQRLRIAPENSIDPFRMACYKIIGRCDLGTRTMPILSLTPLDFMWLQLVLAREISRVDEMATDSYTLSNVQSTVKEAGEKSFGKGAQGGLRFHSLWFLLQILTGLFEDAINYLYIFHSVDAVHFAIALDYYGLLRVSDPTALDNDFMSYTTRGLPQISFGLMVGYYTRVFRAANAGAAVDYLSLICLNKDVPGNSGRNQVKVCHEALRELVLETKEFALLLGDIRGDGQRINGAIEDRMELVGLADTDDFMRTVTIQAASVADDSGRTTDAVLLYHLAGEFDNVIVIITRALSEAIAIPVGQGHMKLQPLKPRTNALESDPTRPHGITDALRPSTRETTLGVGASLSLMSLDDPVQLAASMTLLYRGSNMYFQKIKDANWAACQLLLKMHEAKVRVEEQRWADAMDIIIALDILPLKANGNASEIRSYATKFASLSQAVATNIPNLVMWSILCCNHQRASLMASQYGGNEGTRLMMIQELRQKNMDLTTYTSQLRYRFPTHIHEALARAQSE